MTAPTPPWPMRDATALMCGLGTAAMTAAGIFFQKLNGVRGGNTFLSGWLVLAAVCFFPTFIIANKVFLLGGRMSVFVPATAATYLFSMLIGRFCFEESVSFNKWMGCAMVLGGVFAIARG